MSHRMYTIVVFAIRMIVRVLFRVRITGPAHAPVKGPMLICSNHISNWDPPVIGCFMGRPLSYMAKEELFRFPPLGAILRSVYAFPVRRGAGDRGALRLALDILAQGGTLVMFPEGSRKSGGSLAHLERGVGFLAIKSHAAVQPVIIRGQYKLFRPMWIHYGEPFYVDEELNTDADAHAEGKRIDVDAATELIRQRMLTLLKESSSIA